MKGYRFIKGLKLVMFVIAASFLFGFLIMHLWNWLMPTVFGLNQVTFWQALGLFVLSKILFGGFHRHGGRGRWKQGMKERWEQMTPEERDRFRSGMRGRRGCRPVPPAEPVS
jgi:hypothetical protein